MSDKREELLAVLTREQNEKGGLTDKVMADIAEAIALPLSEVYGVASFYSFFATRPVGNYIIRVCKSLPCYYKNSDIIIQILQNELGIKPGQTTSDGKFTLEMTNCIGGCDKAPAMMVNDTLYNDLTPEKVSEIIRSCK